MTTQAVRIGIIGAGWWADTAHAPGLKRAGAEIAAVLSRSRERAQRLAQKYNASVYSSVAEMAPHVDAVAIATPNNSHVTYALEALKHGLHLFIDKPLALDLAGARSVLKAATDKGVIGITTLSSRGHPVTVRAHELLEQGALGRLLYVRGHFHAEFMADSNVPRVWRAERGTAGAGALGDLGAHLFDLVRYVSGLEFERLAAMTSIAFPKRPGGQVENDDEVALIAELSNGISGAFSLSRVHTGGPQTIEVEVQGTKAAMRVRPALSVNARNGYLEFAERDGVYRKMELADKYWGDAETPIDWDLDWGEFAFAELGRRFIAAIETGKQPSPSLLDGVRAQAVIDAAQLSAQQGGVWTDVAKG